jgi:N-carbamoyl-L-amino-acid hydrolase
MRHPEAPELERMLAELETALPDCARRGRCRIEIAERWGFGGLAFDAALVGMIRASAARRGHATMDLRSEAGHDSYNMATICPTAMIFTPCKGGISHNEAEDMTPDQALPGCNVLLDVALERASR